MLGPPKFDRLSAKDKCEPVGLARIIPCLPQHPTCALSPRFGLKGAADQTGALHLSAAIGRFQADSVLCLFANRFRPGRLVCFSQDKVSMPLVSVRQASRLSSASFPFSVIQPSPHFFRTRPAFESSRFSV
jgi:hypothetical protein